MQPDITIFTDATFGESGHWLGTRTGAGGNATLARNVFGCNPYLHGQGSNIFKETKEKQQIILRMDSCQ